MKIHKRPSPLELFDEFIELCKTNPEHDDSMSRFNNSHIRARIASETDIDIQAFHVKGYFEAIDSLEELSDLEKSYLMRIYMMIPIRIDLGKGAQNYIK